MALLDRGVSRLQMPRAPRSHRHGSSLGSEELPEDFQLGWVGDRIATSHDRAVVVLQGVAGRRRAEVAERFRGIAQRYGGTVDEAAGRLIAVWDAGRAGENDALLAVLAGLTAVADIKAAGLALRCGIGFGHLPRAGAAAVSGEGSDVLAETGMIAGEAPAGTVLVSRAIRDLAGSAFDFSPFGTGHGPVLHQVLAHRADYVRKLEPAPHIVGRDRELRLLDEAWCKATACIRGSTLIVWGEAGIGKSALARYARDMAGTAGGLCVRVRCTPEARSKVAAPIGDLLSRLWFRAGVPGPQLAAGAVTDPRTFAASIEAILELSRRRALVLVVEDLHWADATTLTFFSDLATAIGSAGRCGVMVFATSRSLCRRLAGVPAEVVELGPLRREAMLGVLSGMDGDRKLDGSQKEFVVACAGGNPFVAQQLAQASRADGAGQTTAAAEGAVDLSRVLALRLELLGPLLPLVQAASVLGLDVQPAILAQLLCVDARWLERRLGALETRGVLCEHVGRRGRRFRFVHSLLHEAAYRSLDPLRRRELHGAIGAILAGRALTDSRIDPVQIADHFERADRPGDARAWWRRAAADSLGQAAPHTAVTYLRNALAADDDPPASVDRVEIETLRQLGVALIQVRGSAGPEVRSTYDRALALVRSSPARHSDLSFDLLWGIDAYLLAEGSVTDAVAVGDDLMVAAERLGSRQRQCQLLAARMHAVAMLLSGNLTAATTLYRTAIERYNERLDAPLRFQWVSDQGALAHAHLGWTLSITGDWLAAAQHGREALAIARRLAHAHTSAHVLCVLATAAQIRGDRGAAGALATAGRALAAHHAFPYWIAWADIVAGWVVGGPMPERGLALISDAVDRYRATGAGQALPYALVLLADAELRRGEPSRALQAVTDAREASSRGIRVWDAELDRLEALCRQRLGAPRDQVKQLLARSLEIAERQGARAYVARTLAVAGEGGTTGGSNGLVRRPFITADLELDCS